MSGNLADDLVEASIITDGKAESWRAAVTLAGEALVAGGVTTDAYTQEMITAIDDLGPYVVIAPGLALAHSRPSPAVLKAGLSWVNLSKPVAFGHSTNDPVSLVIGLAAPDHDGHLSMMSSLASVLSDEDALAKLKAAESPSELRELLAGYAEPN